MIQAANLFAYTDTLNIGNAAFAMPSFTISPSLGLIAGFLKKPRSANARAGLPE
jgi:hypothetical protein